MARPATGSIVEPRGARKSWAIRFRANGKRQFVSLGTSDEGWTKRRAEEELANHLADVRRGLWAPELSGATAIPAGASQIPDFHAFASDWLDGRKAELKQRTIDDYTWTLSYHLLPFFKDHPLDRITAAEVDRYKVAKLTEGRIAPAQINKTLSRLFRFSRSRWTMG